MARLQALRALGLKELQPDELKALAEGAAVQLRCADSCSPDTRPPMHGTTRSSRRRTWKRTARLATTSRSACAIRARTGIFFIGIHPPRARSLPGARAFAAGESLQPEGDFGSNARGLMQLIPSTARKMATQNGMDTEKIRLYEPSVNRRMVPRSRRQSASSMPRQIRSCSWECWRASQPTQRRLRDFVSKGNLPVVGTFQAAGAGGAMFFDNFGGRVGQIANQPADRLLDTADLVITVGYDPIEYWPALWNAKRKRRIIHMDVLPADLDNSYCPSVELTGDISQTLDGADASDPARRQIGAVLRHPRDDLPRTSAPQQRGSSSRRQPDTSVAARARTAAICWQ